MRNCGAYGEKYNMTWVDKFGVFLSERRILKYLNNDKNGLSILDVGCGYHAYMLTRFLPRATESVGIDISVSDSVKKTAGIKIFESSAEQCLPGLPADHFDVVIMNSVLEHLQEPLSILIECRRVLKIGGKLLVNVPTWRGKEYLEFAAFRLKISPAVEIDDHKNYYDLCDLWPLLVQAGFKPSAIMMKYHKFGLNLFSVCMKK